MNNNYTGVLLGVVEDKEGKPYFAIDIAGNHVGKPCHCADWQAIGFARQRRQRVIGAEDEG